MSPEDEWDHDRLARRRAIEALRSGVPNMDAVIALGSGQGEIEDRFTGLLEGIDEPRKRRSGRPSVLLGAGFVYYVAKLARGGGNPAAKRLFHYSNLYLALLFLVMVIDRLMR